MNDKLKEQIEAEIKKGCGRYSALVDLDSIMRLIEQNTLTLESKIDENGVVLAKPHECAEGYDVECECTGLCYGSDYANLPTIKQMPSIIRELREENERLRNQNKVLTILKDKLK